MRGIREGVPEALTRVSTGGVLSHEINLNRLPKLLSEAEGNATVRDNASGPGNRRGRRPSASVDVSRAGTGRSRSSLDEDGNPERAAKLQSRDAARYGCGKSETVEGRAFAKRNPVQRNRPRTLSQTSRRVP